LKAVSAGGFSQSANISNKEKTGKSFIIVFWRDSFSCQVESERTNTSKRQ